VKLAVERATILFTDLVGSTAMYEQLGDAPAFRLVWTHFDVLREIISNHRGAIVKTIGDAIMAVFMRPEDALAAAGELHARIGAECKERGHSHPVTLKIGMHDGPCIAVTLNERLDYFGSTVNLAARVEAQSKGGDIVVSRVLADETQDAEKLRAAGWRAEPIAAHCKGFKEPIPMLRFTKDEARVREGLEKVPVLSS
jgi:class 3 adenylate cyclase